jgi:hypothetical protein
MTESPENDNDFELRVKRVRKDRQRLRVVEIRYTPTPDADERLSRALGILLRSGARTATTSEESINAKKEEEPPKDSRPEKIAGQSDGEKG